MCRFVVPCVNALGDQKSRGPGRPAWPAAWGEHAGERAREWLFIEWPKDKDAPTDYWLAHLPAKKTPTLKALAGLARERWRVEQDYRELKDELGLDHFEGRSWPVLAPSRAP